MVQEDSIHQHTAGIGDGEGAVVVLHTGILTGFADHQTVGLHGGDCQMGGAAGCVGVSTGGAHGAGAGGHG